MNDPELIALVTQAGSAGLIGWLWVTERRAGADREKRLAEAHDRLMQERTSVDQLVRCIDANTRALTALEVLCRSDLSFPEGARSLPGAAGRTLGGQCHGDFGGGASGGRGFIGSGSGAR